MVVFSGKKRFLLLLVFFMPFYINAQVSFYATTDAREVLTNSYIQIEFVIENGSGSGFTPPDFSPLTIVSGPSTSSQISIVNGKRSQKKSYGYTLLAPKEGTYIIGPASIREGRKTYESDPMEIRVVKRRQLNKKEGSEDVFIRAEISDSVVYPGQQVLLKYVLYTTQSIGSYNFLSIPDFEGFFTQEISGRVAPVRRVINGREYQSQVVRTYALFPQKTGDLYLQPQQFRVGLVQRNDPFSSFFNRTKQIPLSTNEHWINVLDLPEDPPEGFNGAIGKYSLSANISQLQATTDDAISLKLTIQGNGLSKFIEAPELPLGEIFEVYDPRVLEESSYVTNEEVISKKTFEYLLVPVEDGKYDFKVGFNYFDTEEKIYKTLESSEFRVNIVPGENAGLGLTPEQILEKYQLKPMMIDTRLRNGNAHFFGSALFYVLFGLLLLTIPLMWIWRRYQISQGKIDPAQIRRKRAAKEVAKRLNTAKNLLDSDDSNSFYKAISDALEKYITDKYDIQTAELSKESIREKLLELEIQNEIVDEYFFIVNKCEIALFGGISSTTNNEIYLKANELMQKMIISLEKKV